MEEIQAMNIVYPRPLPEGRVYKYVPLDNLYMCAAKQYAREYRSNLIQPGAIVAVRGDGKIIGYGSIGDNEWHKKGCERVKHNVPTGTRYDLCPGCNPQYHSEPSTIRNLVENGHDTHGVDFYFWGHWWCCDDCWAAMIKAGIRDVYLLDNSWVLFNSKDPNNILGKQFPEMG